MTTDDLGSPVALRGPARRVVSLVPSLTEALASVDGDAVVGATAWCSHPPDLAATRVRGTKNPDLRAIRALSPDLVVANQEENRELDVRRLRDAGVPVWVTRIRTVAESFDAIERLFDTALGWEQPTWLGQAREAWAAPPEFDGLRVAAAVWRDPWMWVGRETFAADLLGRLGCVTPLATREGRYPSAPPEEVDALGLDVVLLPDEPYVFTAADGPEAFARTPTALVSGRMLTWYGPSMTTARRHLSDALRAVVTSQTGT